MAGKGLMGYIHVQNMLTSPAIPGLISLTIPIIMANNDSFDLMQGKCRLSRLYRKHNICKKSFKIGKNGQFLGKIRIFVINHLVSMGNVDFKKLFDIDLCFCDYLG